MRKAVQPQIVLRRRVRYHLRRLARLPASPHRIALGFAAGVLISFTPLLGLHLVLAAAIAFVLRGSVVASAIGTLIGNPLSFPLIWLASYNVGAALLGANLPGEAELAKITALDDPIVAADPLAWHDILTGKLFPLFWPMMAGGVLLGVVAAAASYWILLGSMKVLQSQRKRRFALKLTSQNIEP